MDSRGTYSEFSYFVDEGTGTAISVRFILSQDGKNVIEFVIRLTTLVDDEPKNIVMYDVSERETLNVHKYYQKPIEKHYINLEKSIETMNYIMDYLERNWSRLLLEFREKT